MEERHTPLCMAHIALLHRADSRDTDISGVDSAVAHQVECNLGQTYMRRSNPHGHGAVPSGPMLSGIEAYRA